MRRPELLETKGRRGLLAPLLLLSSHKLKGELQTSSGELEVLLLSPYLKPSSYSSFLLELQQEERVRSVFYQEPSSKFPLSSSPPDRQGVLGVSECLPFAPPCRKGGLSECNATQALPSLAASWGEY